MTDYTKTRINQHNLKEKSNAELWELMNGFFEVHTRLYEWGWLSNSTDMFFPEYTNTLKEYIRKKAKDETEVNTWLVPLTTPDTESEENRQAKEFLGIAKEIGKDAYVKNLFSKDIEHIRLGLPPAIRKKIEAHWEKYKPLGFMYYGIPYAFEHYLKEFAEFFKSGKNAERTFAEMDEVIEEHRERKEQLEKQLEFDEYHRELFAVYAEFMMTKWYRRYAQITSLYHMDALIQEIADRLNISNHEMRCMLFEEIEMALKEGRIDRALLRERTIFCTLYAEKGFCQVLIGDAARKQGEDAKEKIDMDVKELKGQCASLGKAVGTVKIIQEAADMTKMNEGDILVAYATNPDVVPAMKKAAAIVTDQGGVTCHAAIVSRELGIPCLIGTKIATKVLKDGERVDVDATNGWVRKI
ncbi:hypothetical protein KJ765_05275 [Candidatus Micrarchaeota archaeon]|nr:hypothetical protein [Candidatus Micrarchaeota archaeon]